MILSKSARLAAIYSRTSITPWSGAAANAAACWNWPGRWTPGASCVRWRPIKTTSVARSRRKPQEARAHRARLLRTLSLTPSAAKEKLASGSKARNGTVLPVRAQISPRMRWRNRRRVRRRTSGRSHSNYYRDCDPATGRYVESDPIGLAGGSYSTYAYASGNPIINTDPLGLSAPGRTAPWPSLTLPWDFPLNPGQQWRNDAYQQITQAIESLVKACRKPTCQDHFQACLMTTLASRPGSVDGESACLSCRNACVAAGGEWPSSIPTPTRRRIRCDYKNFK